MATVIVGALLRLAPSAFAESMAPTPGSSQDREAAIAHVQNLRLEIERLKLERAEYGIAAPIVMMGVGGGVALGSLYFYLVLNAWGCPHGDCGESDSDGYTKLAVLGVAGAVVGIIGFVMLQNRLGPRRELATQIRLKRSELEAMESRLRFTPMFGANGARGAALSLTF